MTTDLTPSSSAVAGGAGSTSRSGTLSTAGLRSRLAGLTVADGLMVLVGILAAIFRFGGLGNVPLSPNEASAALSAWQFSSVAPLTLPVTSPAYFTLTTGIMALGGDGDAAARLVPATFGVLTVLTVWLWRGRGRPLVWLVAGLFLAVSPLLVAVSRAAGGDAIALFALLLLVVAWARRSEGRRWTITTGAAFGLGLASSPLFYSGLVALAVALPVARALWPAPDVPLVPAAGRGNELHPVVWAAAITFLAVATGFLIYPSGIGAALRLIPAWLAQFGPGAGGGAAVFLSPLPVLLRYEPAIILLGAPAALWAITGRQWPAGILVAWLVALLPIIFLQPAVLTNVALPALPGYLLIGVLADRVARPAPGPTGATRVTWAVAGGMVGLGALLLAALGRFARLGLLSGENATLITLATLAFVLAAVAVIAAMAWESAAARRGAFAGFALLLLFWQWGATWGLSRYGVNDPRERWVTVGTGNGTRLMVDLVGRISRQTANSETGLSIFNLVETPVLDWYFREYPGYRSGPALPVGSEADIIIAPPEIEPALPSDYFGADFVVERREAASAGATLPEDVLKWWLFRESAAATDDRRVIVWVRSGLAQGD